MSPIGAIKSGVMNTFHYSGRTARSDFWWLVACAVAVLLVISALEFLGVLATTHFVGNAEIAGANRLIAILILSLPLTASGYRRLQDVSEDGYLIFLPIVTAVLWLIGNGPYMITLESGHVIGLGNKPSFSISVSSLIFLAMTACSLLLCYRLAWASCPGPNPFGPPPN